MPHTELMGLAKIFKATIQNLLFSKSVKFFDKICITILQLILAKTSNYIVIV